MDDNNGRDSARLTYVEEAIVKIADKIDKLEDFLMTREDRPTNWVGVVTAGLGFFTLLGSISFALLTYVDVRLDQQREVTEGSSSRISAELDEEQATTRAQFKTLVDFRTQTHYELGRLVEFQKIVEQQLTEIKARIQALQDRELKNK